MQTNVTTDGDKNYHMKCEIIFTIYIYFVRNLFYKYFSLLIITHILTHILLRKNRAFRCISKEYPLKLWGNLSLSTYKSPAYYQSELLSTLIKSNWWTHNWCHTLLLVFSFIIVGISLFIIIFTFEISEII